MRRSSETTGQKKNNRKVILEFLSFLLGFFSATDIAYVFTVGNSYILVVEVYSVALLVGILLFKRIKLMEITSVVPTNMKAFLSIIVFSVVLAMMNFYDQASVLSRYVVGMIYLCILLTTAVNVICLFSFREKILHGIEAGIVLNVILCIVQYIAYRRGLVFDILYEMFTQGAFHLNTYNFGAQGLFLEPSHMIQYLGMVFPIILAWEKGTRRLAFLVMILGVAVLSAAGSAVILLSTLVLYTAFQIYRKKGFRTRFKFSTLLVSYIAVSALAILLLSGTLSTVMSEMMSYWNLILSGSNITNAENAQRFTSIQNVAKLLMKFPLGCGWNMAPTVIKQNTLLTTAAAFSDLLEMTLELSVVGITVYVVSLVSVVLRLLATKTTEGIGYAIAIINILVMQTMADCSFDCAMFIIFGLAISYLRHFSMRQDFHKVERIDDY